MNTRHFHRQQRGATLIVGLIFMVALTLLGVIAMKSTVLQERMAGGLRDRSLAFQSAEAALRDAKFDILALRANGTPCIAGSVGCRPAGERPLGVGGAGSTPFTQACTNGQCDGILVGGGYAYGAGPHTINSMTAAPSVPYGQFTGAAPMVTGVTGVAALPRYLIEVFVRTDENGDPRYFYRIVARAVGANLNTVVTLQEVFAP